MQSEEGGKTFPYDVELERPLKLLQDQEYEMKVFVDNTICEIYVGGDVAMSARMYDIQQGKLAVFVSQGAAEFKRVKIETL